MSDLRTKKTYLLLKNALYELLSQKSFEEIKVVDICNTAMIHRTTFYSHFSDKYDLIDFCIREIEKDIKQNMKLNKYTTLKEFYETLITNLLNYIEKDKILFKSVLNKNYDSDIIGIFKNICTSFVLEMLKKEEEKGIKHEIPIDLIAKYYSGAVISSISWWISSNNQISKEDFCNNLISLIFNTKI